jgi:peptidoglycan/xylan/chitin deacetylase (PgdA/CDA1 family)
MKMKITLIILLLLNSFSAKGQSKKICISVDDLPVVAYNSPRININEEITIKLTQTFKKYDIPAIGFVNEKQLYKNNVLDSARVELLRIWLNNGCDLGNHTYSHFDYNSVDDAVYFEDIIKCQKVIKPLLSEYGKTLKYFRHPYLHTGKDSIRSIKLQTFLYQSGYIAAPVTIDNDDYVFAKAYYNSVLKNDSLMSSRIVKSYLKYMEEKLLFFERKSVEVFGKNIPQELLIHASQLNADYMEELAKIYVKHGYTFVSQEEILKQKEYSTEINNYSNRGLSWIFRWGLSLGKGEEIMNGDVDVPTDILEYFNK